MASETSYNPFRRKSSGSTDPPAQHASVDHAENTSIFSRPNPPANPSDFARALESLPKTDAPLPSTTFQKKKPVKKVRVQSPPPSSPESTTAEHTYPKYPLPPRDDDYESSGSDSESLNGERENPFQNEAPPLSQETLAATGTINPPRVQTPFIYTGRGAAAVGTGGGGFGGIGGGPPPNPFQKTLEDIEKAAREGEQSSGEQNSGTGKAGLDVEAFKRLLLTGQGPIPGTTTTVTTSATHPPGVPSDGGSITETSSISRQSISEPAHPPQETPRTSHETSEPEGDEERRNPIPPPPSSHRSGSRKKAPPPPPPATRHGKLIKVELKDKNAPAALDRRTSTGQLSATSNSPRLSTSPSLTDINKPLPPPPERSEDDGRDSIFDKEAAGKVPEIDIDPDTDIVPSPRPPTPPNASHSASTPVQNPVSTLRKPAPPPRRHGHGRSDSKATIVAAAPAAEAVEELATTPPRSSLESQRSRSSSIRLSLGAPAPPPRRLTGHRHSPSLTSPTSVQHSLSSFPFPTGTANPSGSDLSASYHQTDSSNSSTSLGISQAGTGTAKLSPPPPPPQRHSSVRKSLTRPVSTDFTSRKAGGAVPPPPPPRTRGSSKGSMDGSVGSGPGLARVDSAKSREDVLPEETEVATDTAMATAVPADMGASDEALRAMLADLDALQRDVEAARAAAGST